MWQFFLRAVKLDGMKGISGGAMISKLLTNEHAGKWVAISPDRTKVIGYDASLEALDRKVSSKEPNAIYTKGLDNNVSYTF